jgi:predicted TIM-barrel fold metal-dependent hydrolase
MTEEYQGPRARTTPPSFILPPDACDCHSHVFGTADAYPFQQNRSYTPTEASVEMYLAMLGTLGFQRMVIVQPSVYGTDNSCTADAVAFLGQHRCRGVAVVDDAASAAELEALHEAGFRGTRFNTMARGGVSMDRLRALAAKIAPLGWHIQIYHDGTRLPEIEDVLESLPVEVVIDHMGQVMTEHGVEHPGFQSLLRLLDSGRVWVKLTGQRMSSEGPPFADLAPFARAIIARAPERCVFGTDWPHPDTPGYMPDDGELIDLLPTWAPDEQQRRRILVDNPAKLYGFAN